MAQVYYYIPAGRSPEDYNGGWAYVDIVVRDTDGYLWYLSTQVETFKQNLLKNRDYYVDAFNNGSHTGGGSTYNGMYITISNPDKYDENKIYTKAGCFERMIIDEKTAKSYVLTCPHNGQAAISHDFETFVKDCNKVNPRYYTSVPVDRFIVRRSVDDLF